MDICILSLLFVITKYGDFLVLLVQSYLWCRAGIPTYRPYLFAVFGQVPELEFPDIKAVFSLTGFRSFAEVGHR